MSKDVGEILPLPADVSAQIESSTIISSLSSVVLGLVENSLDACSRRIDIHIDFARGSCTVEDDGHGIPPPDFGVDGGLGKPFYTSKYHLAGITHGHNGAFLAAVSALSILTITSHYESYKSLSTLVLHHGKTAARLVPAPPCHQLVNRHHGTKVTVQDLFGNMPVRVKQRIAHFKESEKRDEKELENLKRQMVALLLAWPPEVSITLTSGPLLKRRLNIRMKSPYHTKASNATASVATQENHLSLKNLNRTWLLSLFTQTNYIEPSQWDSWKMVSARTPSVSAQGIISTIPAPHKHLQFLSLGVMPIKAETSGNVLLNEINNLFAASSFGNIEEIDELKELRKVTDRRLKQDGLTNKELRGGGKGVNRWPTFYIRISMYESNNIKRLEREDVLPNVSKVVSAMFLGFLKHNHFRPRARAPLRPTQPPKNSPVSQNSRMPEAFTSCSRIKSSRSFQARGLAKPIKPTLANGNPPETTGRDIDADSNGEYSERVQIQKGDNRQINHSEDGLIEWTSPITRAKIWINSRTGAAAPTTSERRRPSTAPAALQAGFLFAKDRLMLQEATPGSQHRSRSWASNLLAQWQNPVFAPTEAAITRVSNETNLGLAEVIRSQRDLCSNGMATLKMHDDSVLSKISKSNLRSARVISQVDRKFILISFPTERSSKLVLVDQHAADERIRVEALLEDLYAQPPEILTKPLSYEILTRERDLLASRAPSFALFGITYSFSTIQPPNAYNTAENSKCVLTVRTLPPVIAERCRLQPTLLLNILRSIIWSEDCASSGALSNAPSRPPPPKDVLGMINSRACRSAIMFNDVLTHHEAEELIRRLSATKLPFQCAHGRTSMVPLLELGNETEEPSMRPAAQASYAEPEATHKAGQSRQVHSSRRFSLRSRKTDKTRHRGDELMGCSDDGESFTGAWKRWRPSSPPEGIDT